MKKLIAVIVAVVLVCAALTVNVIAYEKEKESPTQGGITGITEDGGDLVVTPILEEEGKAQDIIDRLEEAKSELEDNVEDLTALCADLKKVENVDEYAVLDIVDVFWGEKTQETIDSQGYVIVNFDTKLGENSQLHVIFSNMRGGDWVSYDDKAEVLADGSTDVRVSEPGVFVFLVK